MFLAKPDSTTLTTKPLFSVTTEYQMPFAYYTVKIKACKWYGMRCIDVGEKFEVDLCEHVDCTGRNHTIDEEIIFYGEEEDQYDYWQYHYGYDHDADEEERYQQQQEYYAQKQQEEDEETYAPSEDPDVDEYGNRRYNNYFRNKYAYARQYRSEQQQEKADGRQIAQDLTEFVTTGTVVSLAFTFIPYTGATYDSRTNFQYNRTSGLMNQTTYTRNYGTNYRADNLLCSLPLKIVSDDFDIDLYKKSSRYRQRESVYAAATTMGLVGLLGLSVWGMKKRRLACLGDTENDGESMLDDDVRVTDFVLAADGYGSKRTQPV